MVICDDCEKAFHFTCAGSLLVQEPSHSWVCRKCILTLGKNYGFQDNPEPRVLGDFHKYADEFKHKHFKGEKANEYVVEKEFWKLIGSPYEEVDVEYGADLHTSVHGR